MATVCLRISSVIYLLVGIGGLLLSFVEFEDGSTLGPIFGVFMILFCTLFVVGIEFVAYGLKRRKFWAWIAEICIFALYVPSAFLPLGAFGLWGLLDAGSRREFGINVDSPNA
jgi:hypothetical protein